MTKIDRREDVNPKRGEREYGHVEFVDPTNNKYPIDTPDHVRSAWSSIKQENGGVDGGVPGLPWRLANAA